VIQLVAAGDVAATVAELAICAPVGRVELGGPEALGIDAWARRLFAATSDERTVIADPHARYYGTELHGDELTPGAAPASERSPSIRGSPQASKRRANRTSPPPRPLWQVS
jgi:hypothetical protein